MIPVNINFLKSQKTVGDLREVVMTATDENSQNKQQIEYSLGDRSVARQETKDPQVCDKVFITSFHENPTFSEDSLHTSLMPQTFNYTKVKEAQSDIEWHESMNDLGIELV